MFGTAVLHALLEVDVDVAAVTQDVLGIAVSDELYGYDIITQLVDKFGKKLAVSQKVLERAAGNGALSEAIAKKLRECTVQVRGMTLEST